MIRRMACVALLLAAPAGLSAQTLSLVLPGNDTLLAVPVGQTRQVPMLFYDASCRGVSTYTVTLFYDTNVLHLVAADSTPGAPWPAPTVDSSVPGQVTLSTASGSGGACYNYLANLTFQMDAAAPSGTLVSQRIDALTSAGAVNLLPVSHTSFADICRATHVYGDVDSSLTVTSRDALIALSAAVGLPTPGFNVTYGDVDGDGFVTSRDALFMLSAGTGVVSGSSKAGVAIPDRCAPLAAAPTDLLFFNSQHGFFRIPAGDTVPVTLGLPTTSVPGQANGASPSRLSPDGTRVLYECLDPPSGTNYQTLCTADPDGANIDTLPLLSSTRELWPDWSFDGTGISFVTSGSQLYIAGADGSQPVMISDTSLAFDQARSPTQDTLVFTGRNPSDPCCNRRIFKVAADGGGLTELFTGSNADSPVAPAFSPGGDSVAYVTQTNSSVKVAPLAGGVAGTTRLQLQYAVATIAWSSGGMAFSYYVRNGYLSIFMQLPSGAIVRLTRSAPTSDDELPTFKP